MGQTACDDAGRSGCDRLRRTLRSSSHAGGHWFESSSLHQKVPDFVRNQELFSVYDLKSDAAFWRFSHDPNADPKAGQFPQVYGELLNWNEPVAK